ncbi:Arc family DNA-binding protein [Providencia rettgeri]|uniref:Arc family DNA-binding protein n=1 Tax=Providencia rettgeri TaxID=587 RepID=UPI00200B24E4|nr:Arc family DNA-binding protein [Providencia rettgeri]UPS64235.1 Arc family DNA-binding protein [Providencia rettgeri]
MSREYPQFKLRMPPETRDKLKVRSEMNGRSINAELLQIIDEALSTPSSVSGYKDDVEKMAATQADEVRKMVFDTLVKLYKKDQ